MRRPERRCGAAASPTRVLLRQGIQKALRVPAAHHLSDEERATRRPLLNHGARYRSLAAQPWIRAARGGRNPTLVRAAARCCGIVFARRSTVSPTVTQCLQKVPSCPYGQSRPPRDPLASAEGELHVVDIRTVHDGSDRALTHLQTAHRVHSPALARRTEPRPVPADRPRRTPRDFPCHTGIRALAPFCTRPDPRSHSTPSCRMCCASCTTSRPPDFVTVQDGGRIRYGTGARSGPPPAGAAATSPLPTDVCEELRSGGRKAPGDPVTNLSKTTYRRPARPQGKTGREEGRAAKEDCLAWASDAPLRRPRSRSAVGNNVRRRRRHREELPAGRRGTAAAARRRRRGGQRSVPPNPRAGTAHHQLLLRRPPAGERFGVQTALVQRGSDMWTVGGIRMGSPGFARPVTAGSAGP